MASNVISLPVRSLALPYCPAKVLWVSERKTPQHKVTIPPSEWPEIEEAMRLDGITNFSQFALAAIRQRVRRIKEEKAREDLRRKE